jgi:hypothetical protein
MSKLGIPDRKLWFEHNVKLDKTVAAKNGMKFVFGDIIEQLIVFLAKEAGHTVEFEQKEVEIDGIIGHQDGKIDGVTVDVKSASSFAFPKFSKGLLFKDDPFGYIAQLSAYTYANNHTEGQGSSLGDTAGNACFIGVNKENGEIALLPLDPIDRVNPKERIKEVKALVALPEPPKKKCYEPVPEGTSGNMTLHKNCTYCPFAKDCWSDANNGRGLRYFDYAQNVKALTTVVKTPLVKELTQTPA